MPIGIGAAPPFLGGSPWKPTRLSGCALWLRADLGITLAAGKVSAWANQGSLGGSVSQGTVAEQPVVSAGAIGGRDAISFDGADDALDWSGAANAFNFLHDGTGATVFALAQIDGAAAASGAFLASLRQSAVRIGYELYWDQPNTRVRLLVGNGSGTHVIAAGPLAGTWVAGATHLTATRYQEGVATEWDIRVDGISAKSGNTTLVPSSANPFGGPTVGNDPGGGANILKGLISEAIAYNRYLSDAETARVESYLASRYGL